MWGFWVCGSGRVAHTAGGGSDPDSGTCGITAQVRNIHRKVRVTWDIKEEAILQLHKVSVRGKDSLAHPLSQVENELLLINVPMRGFYK